MVAQVVHRDRVGKGRALVDRDIYLPKAWTSDPRRMAAAGVPAGSGSPARSRSGGGCWPVRSMPACLPPGSRRTSSTAANGRACCPQPRQHLAVQIGQDSPSGGVRGDRAEQVGLIPQHGQVRDRLAPVGQHHGQVDRDPAPVMATLTTSQARQGIAELAGQPGRVSNVGQQPRSNMADDTPTIRGDLDPRAGSSNLHPASAFPDGLMRLRLPSSFQHARHFRAHDPPGHAHATEGPRLVVKGWVRCPSRAHFCFGKSGVPGE